MLITNCRNVKGVVANLKKVAVFSFLMVSLSTIAFPEKCIQSPQRTQACGHLVYKKITTSEDENAEIYCVCLEDFEDIRVPAKDEIGIARQKYALRKYAAELGISEQVLLELVR